MARHIRWFLLLLFCLLVATGFAAEPEVDQPEDEAKQFQAYAKTCAAAYEISLKPAAGDGRELTLIAEPVLRWTNPLAGRQAHGEVFVWTDDGRPTAVLSLYQWTAPDKVVHEHHEFCSLATGPLATTGPESRDWSPSEAGVKLIPLPDAPPPADSPRQRLRQMRDLAARFSGQKTTREDHENRDLRLLTQPVQRYDSRRNDVLDGALFALVEHTDPEILLVLEARVDAGKPTWQYACVRMNSLRLAVSLDGREVWQAEQLAWRDALNRKDLPYTAFTIR
jgi:hypothetical protein